MTKTTAPTVICAWCDRLMASGTGIVSHGICRECARALTASVAGDGTDAASCQPNATRRPKSQH